ncbi:hypothetical protein BO70DRAFT_379263 [Aspergillus heteromorphus CBS 117.55]|uniref:Serine hydrolase domain-containing protein n=1 Tax=Aspergillus heteromorphus CBS 117.55 TaxID=1448321 RepID=A0A317WCF8_9EURO|nr:uncharacterized protein BO70DRAFT_379263 [Aspergillus heteromorphus CBS 117.55]PWY83451.1 hypothetical protein BO70DRAFT_379263 [Aspergillus heteromorphus CBS 117.55]
MRFLCLHGAGTSAEIFEIQTGGITYDLSKKGHTFKYVNGYMEDAVEPELKDIFEGPFYSHYPRDQAPREKLAPAIKHVQQIIEKDGPFDAVMGFSQGAALACALIVQHAQTHQEPLFKLAVFICGAAPFDSTGSAHMSAPAGEYPVQIPTTHIVGKQDPVYPQSMRLFRLCEPGKVQFYDHGSKHMVPFDMKNTEAMVAAIEASVQRAGGGEQ